MEIPNAQDPVYRYTPTGTGFRVHLASRPDPLRKIVCPLFPDNRKEIVFQGEQYKQMDLHPFRPVVYALLAPGFIMDLHGASGLAGYGRFALVSEGGESCWLDECEEIETEYRDGELRYTVRDGSFCSLSLQKSQTSSRNR